MGSIIDLVRFEADLLASSNDGPSTTAAPPPRPRMTSRRLAAAVLLWCKSPAVLLLAPIQATFGLCAALLGYEIAGKVWSAASASSACRMPQVDATTFRTTTPSVPACSC